MIWNISHRADPRARDVADRHYSRQTVGAAQFVPPGRCLVLFALTRRCRGRAYWVTSWPFPEWVKHEWPGAWVCSAFRNEAAGLSSVLVRDAIACTRWFFGDPPAIGMVTFVDPDEVRAKSDPGYCFIKAGFKLVGMTKGGLPALQMLPADMPPPAMPMGATRDMFAEVRP